MLCFTLMNKYISLKIYWRHIGKRVRNYITSVIAGKRSTLWNHERRDKRWIPSQSPASPILVPASIKGQGILGWIIHLAWTSPCVCRGAHHWVLMVVSCLKQEMEKKYMYMFSCPLSLTYWLTLTQSLVQMHK